MFYENEPDFTTKSVEKKWALISGAGFIVSSILGYFFTGLFFVTENYIKTSLCFFAIIFLVVDSLYFFLGSVFNFGDIVGVRESLIIPKWVSIIICAVMFIFHCSIITMSFYRRL